MPPSFFKTFLVQPLTEGGSETTVYVNGLDTLTNEEINFAEFAPFTRGLMIVDPEAQFSAQPEIISFTGVDSTNISFTGSIRGLSAISASVVTANKVYHGTNTPVIISWGAQNISDLITYVQGLVVGSIGSATNTTAGSTRITENMGSRPRAVAATVSQQSSPNLTLLVGPVTVAGIQTDVVFAGGSSGSFLNPATNSRIDLLVYSPSTALLAIRQGTEAVSPTKPSPNTGDIVLAEVFNRHGETMILENNDGVNGYIMHWYNPQVYRSDIQIYGSDATGSGTTYTISPIPSITALYVGFPVTFRPQITNTGASTLNVNSLGAKPIKKNVTAALVAGDLVANEMVSLIYDGTNFQLINPPPATITIAKGTTSHTLTDVAATVIAHGLGVIPKRVRIVGNVVTTVAGYFGTAETVFSGSSQASLYMITYAANTTALSGTTFAFISTITGGSTQNGQSGTVTVDATNITITWAAVGTPSGGAATLMWEAMGLVNIS